MSLVREDKTMWLKFINHVIFLVRFPIDNVLLSLHIIKKIFITVAGTGAYEEFNHHLVKLNGG